jgi:aspartyl/asparaginyl beta-hydroxylase (cupin superfamily)
MTECRLSCRIFQRQHDGSILLDLQATTAQAEQRNVDIDTRICLRVDSIEGAVPVALDGVNRFHGREVRRGFNLDIEVAGDRIEPTENALCLGGRDVVVEHPVPLGHASEVRRRVERGRHL